jgi:hypothetical protein
VAEKKGETTRYISLAPEATAFFFLRYSEMQGPVSNLCSLLGNVFPGTIVSISAVYSFTGKSLQLVVGVSAPLDETNAETVDGIMDSYFQPIMDRMHSEHKVLVALGENLGQHSTDRTYDSPAMMLADLDGRFRGMLETGPLGRLFGTSVPLHEQGKGDDLARLYRVVNGRAGENLVTN